MKSTKNNKKLTDSIDVSKIYEPIEAIKILKEHKYANFNETLEVAINLGIDANKTDQGIRGVTSLPKGKHICIDIQEQHEKMPIGDQLASVVLALANDNLMVREIYTLSREIVDD